MQRIPRLRREPLHLTVGCTDLRRRHIMLEIDYPHSDSNWPNSRKRAAEALAGVPDDELEKIVESNARTLLRFPR